MNPADAARLLSVAEHEVLDTRLRDGWWEALHHDMASHEETWRPLPFVVRKYGVDVFAQPYADPGDEQPGRDSGVEGSPESGFGEVPAGPAKDVLAWVGDDSDRAVAALEAEEQRDSPRTTLVAALEKVIG